jgi:hypothetical protein
MKASSLCVGIPIGHYTLLYTRLVHHRYLYKTTTPAVSEEEALKFLREFEEHIKDRPEVLGLSKEEEGLSTGPRKYKNEVFELLTQNWGRLH